MQITSEHEQFVHTIFVTDGLDLSDTDAARIERELNAVLAERRLVARARWHKDPREAKLRVVLGCLPRGEDQKVIRERFKAILAPLPLEPARTTRVKIEQGPFR